MPRLRDGISNFQMHVYLLERLDINSLQSTIRLSLVSRVLDQGDVRFQRGLYRIYPAKSLWAYLANLKSEGKDWFLEDGSPHSAEFNRDSETVVPEPFFKLWERRGTY